MRLMAADIVISVKGQPLAVLELKRNGIPISSDDVEQGLSYARMLNPMPPLVVVTNGTDIRLLETYSGEDWNPPTASDAEFAKLVQAASRAAAVDTKRAVEVLPGTGSDIWVSAVRQATAHSLRERLRLEKRRRRALAPFPPDTLRFIAFRKHRLGEIVT